MLAKIPCEQRPAMLIHGDRCKRLRFRKSNCRMCVEVCPENAISLCPSPEISSTCSKCGLCRTACPTEVFETEPDIDEYLFRQARLIRDNNESPVGPRELIIRCREAEAPGQSSLAVPCLGSISENTFVGAALLGFREVVLVNGICQSCRIGSGEKLLRESMKTSDRFAKSLGFAEFSSTLEERPKTGASSVGRREIFSAIGIRLRTGFRAATIDSGAGVHEAEVLDTLFSGSAHAESLRRRNLLREILLIRSRGNAGTEHDSAALPWCRPGVDEECCTACGICVSVCPTGALVEKPANDHRILALRASDCTGCGVCGEACPERAIDLSVKLTVTDLLHSEPREVANISFAFCTECGDKIPAARGPTCPTCEKRQPAPYFLRPHHGVESRVPSPSRTSVPRRFSTGLASRTGTGTGTGTT